MWCDADPPDYSAFARTTLTYLGLSGGTSGIDQLVHLRSSLNRAGIHDDTLAGIATNLTQLTHFSEWFCGISKRARQAGLQDDYLKGGGRGQHVHVRWGGY